MSPNPIQDVSTPLAQPSDYEATHVHKVYSSIAPHFSSTRYKPWPLVATYLGRQVPGAIGLDIGCGNGKYLTCNPNVYTIGSDRSGELMQIARGEKSAGHKECDAAIVGDILALAHPSRHPGRFDYAISIAVMHHLSTPDRRVEGVRCILEVLAPYTIPAANQPLPLSIPDAPAEQPLGRGTALIYVWALEQKGSRRGWEEGGEQDVMVPWVKQGVKKGKGADGAETQSETLHRYYHLYRKGELEEDIVSAGGVVLESGYERDNWWAIARRGDA